MPVPEEKELRRPLLESVRGESPQNFSANDFLQIMAEHFGEDINEMPLVDKNTFKSRINKAKSYLKKHNLLSNPSLQAYMITKSGLDVLDHTTGVIDDECLESLAASHSMLELPEFEEAEVTEEITLEPAIESPDVVVEEAVDESAAPETEETLTAEEVIAPEVIAQDDDDIVLDAHDEDIVLDEADEDITLDAQNDDIVLDAHDEDIVLDEADEDITLDAQNDDIVLDAHDEDIALDEHVDDIALDIQDDIVLDAHDDDIAIDTQDDIVLDAHDDDINLDAHDDIVLDTHDDEDITLDDTPDNTNGDDIMPNDELTQASTNEAVPQPTKLDDVLARHNTELADRVLARVAGLSSDAFDVLVIDLLSKMGYRAFQNARYTSNNEMIQGVILDIQGSAPIYIHAKKLNPGRTIGRADVQDFVEALSDNGGTGIFATTASFSENAAAYAQDERIMLIDGAKLVGLMIAHNFCVNVARVFEVKEIDEDSFNDYDN